MDSWSPTSKRISFSNSFFSWHRDAVPAAVKGSDWRIAWKLRSRPWLWGWLKKRKEHVSTRSNSASSAEPQAATVTAPSAFTSPPLGKYCSAQLTNYGPWLVTACSYILKHPVFYLISVLFTPLLLTTSQGKYTFSTKSILTAKGALLATFSHTLNFLLTLSGWNQIPVLFNPFKFRIWCRFLIGVIFFLLTILITSSQVLWFFFIWNTLNWKNPRTPQLFYGSALLPEFVISLFSGYLVVQSIDL